MRPDCASKRKPFFNGTNRLKCWGFCSLHFKWSQTYSKWGIQKVEETDWRNQCFQCMSTTNTINAIFTCFLWFTLIVVALEDLQTTVPPLLRYRVGTADLSCLQRCGVIQSGGINPGHRKAPHICSSGEHSTSATNWGNNELVHLKSLISLISFVKIHSSIKNFGFDQSYGVVIYALWRLGNNLKCKSKATSVHNLNVSPFCKCFFLQNNQNILLGRMRARKECSSPAGG